MSLRSQPTFAQRIEPRKWRNPVIAHIHVPKCAGSSFRSLLDRHFGAAHLHLYVDETFFIYSEMELAQRLEDPAVQAFSSHFVRTYPASLAGRDLLYITFLRDPVQQFISYLTYNRKWFHGLRDPGILSCFPPDFLSLSLREATRWIMNCEREINFRDNYTTAFFARLPFRALYGESAPESLYRERRLKLAQSVLEKFFFVGITEQMDRSVALLQSQARAHGINFPLGAIGVENTSSEHRDDVSWIRSDDEVGALLLRSLRDDRSLYGWAVERLSGMGSTERN